MPANAFNNYNECGIDIGLRVPHYRHILAKKPVVDWFEIISENFMVDGGRPLEVLDQILEQYRVVQHGVALGSKGQSSQNPLPAAGVTHLAVHRFDNMLYFKRLQPEGYAILEALAAGSTLGDACIKAVEQSRRTDVNWQALIKEWFDNWAALGWFCRTD